MTQKQLHHGKVHPRARLILGGDLQDCNLGTLWGLLSTSKNDMTTSPSNSSLFSKLQSSFLFFLLIYLAHKPWASHSYTLSVPIHSQQATSPHQVRSFS